MTEKKPPAGKTPLTIYLTPTLDEVLREKSERLKMTVEDVAIHFIIGGLEASRGAHRFSEYGKPKT